MILDLRTYTLQPGKLGKFLELFEAEGLALQTKHCGRLIGYFTTETGTLHQVIQLWAYEDSADRDRRRAALWADPAWLAFGEKVLDLFQHQESRLLRPTSFSPLR